MPIRPENLKRYPENWPEIVARVRERSGDRCEGSPAFPDCRVPNGAYRIGETWSFNPDALLSMFPPDVVPTRIVLTTGHLDHTPENCDLSNLRHWCQRCHLRYDAAHHAQTRYRTRRAGRAIGDLFE